MEEITKLISGKFTKKKYELMRDLFVFCCFTGLSWTDMRNLTKDNIQKSFDGHVCLTKRREWKAISVRWRLQIMSKAEVMLIMILFHDSGYRCLKHFYLEKVCRHLRHIFPMVVSYNRFVELEKEVSIPPALFIKKVLLGKCTGVSFVDSTPLRVCRNQRIHIHKVFKGIHSWHWSFDYFIVNLPWAIAAYCLFPKKPCINVRRTLDTQLAIF